MQQDSFDNSTTSVQLEVPIDVTGIERIMLAAQGDLQRLLSSFFARPISIDCIYTKTSPRTEPASPEYPITQSRQVHLVCDSRVVCVATSDVMITSPESEHLFLDEHFPIGQCFRKMRHTPQFTFLHANAHVIDGKRALSRTYRLEAGGLRCDISEEFPDRDMFARGESWLNDRPKEVTAKPIILEEVALSAVDDLFVHTPHSLNTTPTLSSILEKQAADPVIGQKIFAAYPPYYDTHAELGYAEITYAQFAKLVNFEAAVWYDRLVYRLPSQQESSTSEPPVVALLGDSGFHIAVTIMALLKLNVTVFLLAPGNSEAAIAHLLSECRVSILLHGEGYTSVSRAATAKCSTITMPLDDFPNPPPSPPVGNPRRVLYPNPPAVPIIVHSSGSTSFPKPVRWSNASFISNSQVMLTSGGWSAFAIPDNVFLCLGPLFHTMGLTIGLAGTICAGTTIAFPLTSSWPPTPADIARSLSSKQIKTCIIVPLLLEQLIDALEVSASKSTEDPLTPLINLRLLLVGGAHCPDKLADRLVSRGVNLKYVYGSSETGHLMVGSHDRLPANDRASWNLLSPFPYTSVIFKSLDDEESLGEPLYEVHMAANDVRLAVGVLKEGEKTWNTGDIVQEVPRGSGRYKLLYRNDDILVHVSGEKTNPVPMETSCRSHKLIERIAIIGHRRPVCAAIIQLDEVEAALHTEQKRLSNVRQAIKEANADAPSHSRVVEEMIMILPLRSEKQIPRTPKGNCIRPKVLQLFAEEIDALYRAFEGDNDSFDGSSVSSSITLADVQGQVSKIVEEVIEKPLVSPDANISLFDVGLDSVTAMRLRNRLAHAFDMKLPQQFIYQNFSLSLLALALHDRVASRAITPSPSSSPAEIGPSKGDIMQALIDRQLVALRKSADVLLASRSLPRQPVNDEGQVVGIVGAAGSLGIWQVKSLLDRSDVQKVVCLVRGATVTAVYEKMLHGFTKAGLQDLARQTHQWRDSQLNASGTHAVNLDQRLVVVPFDLAHPQFEANEYLALASTLTAIIHTGWKMDFNQVVQAFEKDCLDGTTWLLVLSGFMRPKRFYFISSIGAVMESSVKPVPEKILPWSKDQQITASPHGYSESKLVCEYVVEAASTILNIPCSIARIGQISGDTLKGVWKTQEMNPIIIAGSARVGKFPVVPGAVLDWTPVDVVGQSTVELALAEQASGSTSVHHIVNPHPSTYAVMAEHLQGAGLDVTPTPTDEWWAAIQADEHNPCLAIESYIEEAFVDAQADMVKTGGQALTLDISRTLELAPTSLAKCPPLDSDLWRIYIQYWRTVGFIATQ